MSYCVSFYTYCSSLSVGCYLYTDVKRTTTVSAGWVSDGTNVYSVNSAGMITAVNACSNCQPSGTFITSYCSGYDLYYTYANGNCGTYNSLYESNSATCGYTPPSTCYYYAMYDSGYVYYTDCLGSNQYQYFNWYDAFCGQILYYGPAYQAGLC